MITLDDVSMLFHIPIVGQFCTYVMLDFTTTSIVLVELLGLDLSDAMIEMRLYPGAHV